MAVLGAQLVFSMIVFSFLQKLSGYYSFGRWLLCDRLVRYLHPTDKELRELLGPPATSHGGRGKTKKGGDRYGANGKSESFNLPRNIPIQLEMAKVDAIDLLPLQFYSEFQWLMDYSVSAFIVYLLTEGYYGIGEPKTEFNVSVLWCLLAIGFSLRLLMAQLAMYFRTEEGGERILCLTFGFFYLVAAMGILVVDNEILEFGLEDGYKNFSDSAMIMLSKQGLDSHGPVSYLTFKIILAFLCAFIGALMTFPGLRLAKTHLDTLKYAKGNPMKQAFIHTAFVLPLIYLLMWVKPIGRDLICGKHWQAKEILEEPVFEILRMLVALAICIIRISLLAPNLQAYLNLAYERVEKMKKESGKITNIELQRMVARVFYYLCVVAIQYVAPLILFFFVTVLLKTLGGYHWVSLVGIDVKTHSPVNVAPLSGSQNGTDEEGIVATAAHFSWALANIRSVFTPVWYSGLLSFFSWWICASWFTSTVLGVLYYSRIADA
ncbi:transmembrane protein 161B-like [Liolophura sinensis]|uniref:transmembrane protein 161B-like n=1 Tax=Liolophura sinensis TaxID=3198878 RepID=UPI00315830F9